MFRNVTKLYDYPVLMLTISALQIVEKIFEKSDLSWELLFNPLDFFSMYK